MSETEPTSHGGGPWSYRYGSIWANEAEWARQRTPTGVPSARSGEPWGKVGELRDVWVTATAEVPVRGYLCVLSKRHVNEPFELTVGDQLGFWRDAMTVAQALYSEYRPIKMNYEIHGNTVPHLHLHLFPRYADDSFVGLPINGGEVHHHDDVAELERLAGVVRTATLRAD